MRINQPGKPSRINGDLFPFYPFLFGIYPVLSLAAVNIAQIDLSLTYRLLVFSCILAAALFLILRLIIRDWKKAALLALFLLVLFFSYGHVYNFLKNPGSPFLGLVRHRILGPVWFGLAGLSIWIATRIKASLPTVTRAVNITVVILIIFPVFQIGRFAANNRPRALAAGTSNSLNISLEASQSYPDIYYIILDGYMRADNIKIVYGFDNSAFIQALTRRRFYVANCSQSNYAFTEHSLASSLNVDYLNVLGALSDDKANSLIKNSSVRRFLEKQGYTIVAFESGFSWSQWEDADVYYKYVARPYQLNGFELLFLETTLIRIQLDNLKQNKITSSDSLDHDRVIANINRLKDVPAKVKEPKFVFAHLVIPHPPYVYSPNGAYVPAGPLTQKFIYDLTTPANDKPGYKNAVLFINDAILKVVDNILAGSKIPPVIIIQGDHGAFRFSAPEQRMSILNAYYLPEPAARDSLYPSITPVNTFRILFDSYFGQNLPLLPDVSRYSPVDSRWSFETVPNQCH
jgi:hypothetical protein